MMTNISVLPWCVHIIETKLWGPNASSWKFKGETVYPQQARSKWNLYLWCILALGQQASHLIPSHIFVLFLHQGRPYLAKRKKKEEEEKEKEGKGLYTRPKKAETTDEGIEAPKIFTQVLNLRRISLYCSLWCIIHITISANHHWFQHPFYS